jgi:hypothetical protein
MRRSFPFEDLSDDEFEQLVVAVCRHVLGTGVFSFATGKDGGRDGRFTGTATKFPSAGAPLSGKFVIQAKHTANPVASCSDSEFKAVLKKEKPRVKTLVQAEELEHYLLFTNRKGPAGAVTAIENDLKSQGSKTAHLVSTETLRSWLVVTSIWHELGFDRYERSFTISPDELTELVSEFHTAVTTAVPDADSGTDFTYVEKSKKNKINKLSDAYYNVIVTHSLPHFKQISDFLKNPRNVNFADSYHDSADEIRQKIATNVSGFEHFDDALTYVYDEITSSNPKLCKKRRFVTLFLHYMYFNCDIGQHA